MSDDPTTTPDGIDERTLRDMLADALCRLQRLGDVVEEARDAAFLAATNTTALLHDARTMRERLTADESRLAQVERRLDGLPCDGVTAATTTRGTNGSGAPPCNA